MADNTVQTRPKFELPFDDKKANIAFLAVLLVGLIIFTVIMFYRSKPRTFEARFSDQIYSEIELSSNKMTLTVTVNDSTITQTGKLQAVQKDDGYKIYQVEFEDEVVQIMVSDGQLVMAYASGEALVFEET